MQKELEEGQVVLCTVTKIVGTTVFVNIDDYGKEGTIITSEVAPGRIRNLRDYVVPNKKIVCRVLRVEKGHIDLSLRRVTVKEKKEVLENYKREKNLEATLKTILKNTEKVIAEIKKKYNLVEFFEQAKENPKLLKNLMEKNEAEKLLKILKEKKEREASVKKEFSLSCQAEDGIKRIKRILPPNTIYLAAGKFLLTEKGKDYKEANIKLNQLFEEIEKKAKEEGCVFRIEK